MIKSYKSIFFFLFGAVFAFLLAYFWVNFQDKKEEGINQNYHILNHQLQRLNKMLVLEQNFSSFQTHKSSAFEVAGFEIFPKEMVLYSTAKTQVVYDLKKLRINIDEANKKLIVKEIPEAEIKIYPNVEIHFMNDYAVNRFDKNDLNKIMDSAKKNMVKSIDQNQLKSEAKKQLITNLEELFVLAKTLNYTIQDNTKQLGIPQF